MIINLWSGPRNISTALMYSFANREDVKVVDEPFYAHYLRLTGLDHPGKEEVLNTQSVDQNVVIQNVINKDYSEDILFVKNMAHHSEGLDLSFSEEMKNIFLLREPEQMITSFIKQIPNPTLQDVAFKYQFDLLQSAIEKGDNPIVIDSKDLLQDPEKYLIKLCSKLDIPFSDKMLKWEKGAIEEDGIWAKYWYKSVHDSTGFQPYVRKDEQVPERLKGLLEECNYYYSKLIKYKL